MLLLTAQVASNLWLGLGLRRGTEPSDRRLGGLILFDIVILTALMGLTGGPSNPFTISYLVYITLAAVTLNARGHGRRPRRRWPATARSSSRRSARWSILTPGTTR